jgi:hypothetical protein
MPLAKGLTPAQRKAAQKAAYERRKQRNWAKGLTANGKPRKGAVPRRASTVGKKPAPRKAPAKAAAKAAAKPAAVPRSFFGTRLAPIAHSFPTHYPPGTLRASRWGPSLAKVSWPTDDRSTWTAERNEREKQAMTKVTRIIDMKDQNTGHFLKNPTRDDYYDSLAALHGLKAGSAPTRILTTIHASYKI